MKVLVAGGAGFIGSHLCKKLLENGHDVYCVDSLITGNFDNIKSLTAFDRFHFLKADICAPLDAEFTKDGFDCIFHLASPASPNPKSPLSYLNHPFETLSANSIGTRNLLYLAQMYHAKFLFASTSEIYGDPKISPQKEDYWGNVNPNG
ncbi:MAG: GDP-mannose 4,6-dehydratase, partial [Candidatus Omnitrophica bacterium]|nr:GDP-mannose 4,6-dehydratase [Candidatus Omnitrophota bacterium]